MGTYTIIFNLFYSEVGDRLLQCENLGANIRDVDIVGSITGDEVVGPCLLTKVTYTIKDGYEPTDVAKELRKFARRDFTNY